MAKRNILGIARDLIIDVITNNTVFSLSMKAIFKQYNLMNDEKNTISAIAGCELRHHLIFQEITKRAFGELTLENAVSIYVALANVLFVKKIDETETLLFVYKTLDESGVEYSAEEVTNFFETSKNTKELIKVLLSKLPEGDKLFEQDIVSDRSEKFMISEIMREKILLKFDKEIPHGIAIIINKFAPMNNSTWEVNLDIVCEKPNHKAILIGKGGKAIKEVSSFARQDMEKFLGRKVMLTTYVKVKEDWRNSAQLMKQYGYEG